MRPYATDWTVIDPTCKNKGVTSPLWFSESLNLWLYKDVIYDERSATHNGLIGQGAQLHTILEQHNGR